MDKARSTFSLILLLLASSLPILWLAWRLTVQPDRSPREAVPIKLQIDGGKERIDLMQTADGSYRFLVQHGEDLESLTPDALADRLYRQASSRGWIARLLNISSPLGMVWVGIGLLGQVLFTGRMVIQWLASEKNRQSVVPPLFWWMSLLGAMMLLAYFLWRRDIVGILGQSFGLIIYVRNIYFIYNAPAPVDPSPHPALEQSPSKAAR